MAYFSFFLNNFYGKELPGTRVTQNIPALLLYNSVDSLEDRFLGRTPLGLSQFQINKMRRGAESKASRIPYFSKVDKG